MKSYTLGITKEEFVAEMKYHQAVDHFIAGAYDEGEGGCAIGCSLKSIAKLKDIDLSFNEHRNMEIYGICPEWLARVEDTLFEGMSENRRKTWPVDFAEAINTGAELDKIRIPFVVFVLENNIKIQEENLKNNPELADIINMSINANKQMIAAQLSGPAARSAAESAARSAARSAAESAARSAGSAARSAWSAARSARSAWSAAGSAAGSAESAAWSAAGSAAWSAAWSAAESAYEKFADELLRLMRECK